MDNNQIYLEIKVTQDRFVLRQSTQVFDILVSDEFPYLSLVSMIAPSPDWIVGVSHLRLYTPNGGFTTEVSDIPLYAIDGVTQNGDFGGNFSLRNSNTSPQQAIGTLTGEGFQQPFAFVSIRRL